MEEIVIYKFQLESIQNALRLTANMYDCRECKTCFDRNVKQAEQYAKNALEGNKDIRVNRFKE